MTYDKINPSHYHGDRRYEPIDVIEDWGLNYRLGCALKYISRNGRKPGEDPREGLRKAIWYLEREIEALESPSPYVPPTDVQYEDVLEYYGQTLDLNEAWPEQHVTFGEPVSDIPFDATDEDWEKFWQDDTYNLHVTDSSVFLEPKAGPVGASGTDVLSWDADEDFMWDPSLGPIELTQAEIDKTLAKKDLEQFDDDEIVSSFDRRGLIIGVKKDGSTCILGKDGTCET